MSIASMTTPAQIVGADTDRSTSISPAALLGTTGGTRRDPSVDVAAHANDLQAQSERDFRHAMLGDLFVPAHHPAELRSRRIGCRRGRPVRGRPSRLATSCSTSARRNRRTPLRVRNVSISPRSDRRRTPFGVKSSMSAASETVSRMFSPSIKNGLYRWGLTIPAARLG